MVYTPSALLLQFIIIYDTWANFEMRILSLKKINQLYILWRNFIVDKYNKKQRQIKKQEGFNQIYIMSRNFLAQLRKIPPSPQESSAVSHISVFYFIAGESRFCPSWRLITTGAALSMFQWPCQTCSQGRCMFVS